MPTKWCKAILFFSATPSIMCLNTVFRDLPLLVAKLGLITHVPQLRHNGLYVINKHRASVFSLIHTHTPAHIHPHTHTHTLLSPFPEWKGGQTTSRGYFWCYISDMQNTVGTRVCDTRGKHKAHCYSETHTKWISKNWRHLKTDLSTLNLKYNILCVCFKYKIVFFAALNFMLSFDCLFAKMIKGVYRLNLIRKF